MGKKTHSPHRRHVLLNMFFVVSLCVSTSILLAGGCSRGIDSSREAEKLAVASKDYPLAGFWKENANHDFGLAIAPAGKGLYSISFCGSGGCFEPGTYVPNSPIYGDPKYRVIDANTIEMDGIDGFARFMRSPSRTSAAASSTSANTK